MVAIDCNLSPPWCRAAGSGEPLQMRNIYVVTHPEATHRAEGVVGGWHDSQLTSAGARAAASIAEALRSRIPEDADVEVFSSDRQLPGRLRKHHAPP